MVSKIKASAAGCGRARTAGCRRVVLLRGSGAGGAGGSGEKGGGGEGCGGDRVCGEAGGGGEGGEGEARFSGEGPSPLFLLDFAGISRRALGDAREPYTCRPSL